MSRPPPLRVVVVNGMSSQGGTPEVARRRAMRISRKAAEDADLILGSEFASIVDDTPLGKEWDTIHDPSSADRAGSLLALRRSRGQIRWYHYRIGSPQGFTIRTRWLIVAKLVFNHGTEGEWKAKVIACHAPPKRAWALTGVFMASVRARRSDIAGADWNRLGPFVAKALGRKVRFVHILGVALRKHIPASDSRALDVGGDHEAVAVTLYPTHKE